MLSQLHHHHYLLILMISISAPHLAFSYEDPRYTFCHDATTPESTYTPNSTFSTNLNTALTILHRTTAATGFSTATSANVTALALCRATISSFDCQLCVEAAALDIRTACPNQTQAQAWYNLCMIRYSNTNFIKKSDKSLSFMLSDARYAQNNNDTYDHKVERLMQNLSYTAGASEKRYAVGRTTVIPKGSFVYGYVDCTRDVSGRDCRTCLAVAIARIPLCCLGKWAGWVATPTCNIQFNMDPGYHDDWFDPPPLLINTDVIEAVGSPPSRDEVNGGSRGGGLKMVGLVSGVVAVVVVLGVLSVMRWKWNKTRYYKEDERVGSDSDGGEDEDMELGSFLYDYDVLMAATDNFSLQNRLGGGGFCSVYRGRFPSSREYIAVKKLEGGSTQGVVEFLNEVRLLMKMQHRNLVQLRGCFHHLDQMMLVYEYLSNKSLNYFIFDKSKSALLDWTKRFNIIKGVARGLVYLHEDSRLRIIHRDIKASNILLDDEMNPKISDFGLARLFDDDQTRLRTNRIVGTFGYMAPEYAFRGMVSTKADVYSFGVLVLEIISGMKNFDLKRNEESQELLKYTMRLERQGRLAELIDVTIGDIFLQEDVFQCVHVALLCCRERAEDRPTMSSALLMLTSDTVVVQDRDGHTGNSLNQDVHSNNSVTFSSVAHGR